MAARGKGRKINRNIKRNQRTGRSARSLGATRARKIRNLMRVNGLTRQVATNTWDDGDAVPAMANETREARERARLARRQRSEARYGRAPVGVRLDASGDSPYHQVAP